jgi:hypothetical protein
MAKKYKQFTLREIHWMYQSFQILRKFSFPLDIAYTLAENIKEITEHYELIEEARKQRLPSYYKSGKIEYDEEGKQIPLTPNQERKFESEMNEFLESKNINLLIHNKVNLQDPRLSEFSIDPFYLRHLLPFFENYTIKE